MRVVIARLMGRRETSRALGKANWIGILGVALFSDWLQGSKVGDDWWLSANWLKAKKW